MFLLRDFTENDIAKLGSDERLMPEKEIEVHLIPNKTCASGFFQGTKSPSI